MKWGDNLALLMNKIIVIKLSVAFLILSFNSHVSGQVFGLEVLFLAPDIKLLHTLFGAISIKTTVRILTW